MRIYLATVIAVTFCCPGVADAQEVPVVALARPAAPEHALASGTEVFVKLNQELSSKRVKEGEMFGLTVSNDVMLGQYVVIPKGSLAMGEVTWRTGRAVFGKSGKMEIELRYVDLNGRRIPINGKFRQEGEGSTVAAVGAVVLAAPLLFITGKSARIPEGRELKGYTSEAIPVALPAGATIEAAPVQASAPASSTP
ncbi:hypothetical protein [Sphingomonas sp.]|jgi:hypothetical protein|uniref:hypothetical protein n=1 Tax=Sphingomonas sp. TaxID=28214 RepID=UPI002EDA5198